MYDPKKLIVEATLTPLDQLAKPVDENYSSAGQLANPVSFAGHPSLNVRYTINLFPYKKGLLRVQWHCELASTKHPVTLAQDFKPDKVMEKLYATLDPWIARLQHDFQGVKNEAKIVQTSSNKNHVAVLLCLHSETEPDKFHPDDKDAIVRIQYILYKLATEYVMSFFFEDMVPLQQTT
jgi:hypothetical protein